MAEFNIALIPGDGIGPEIVSGAVTVLDAVSKKYGHKFNYQEVYMGGCAIDKYGFRRKQLIFVKNQTVCF